MYQDTINFLKQFLFWNHLSRQEQLLVMDAIYIVRLEQGQILYSPQRECKGLVLIQQGVLRTYMLSEEGREVTLYRQTKGEVCVLSSVCAIKTLDIDVHIEATQVSMCYIIPIDIFEAIMIKNIYMENYVLREISDKFSKVLWLLQEIRFKKFDMRLADYLLLHQKLNNVEATHEIIARDLNTAREVVSRMLKHFESEGWIALERKKITILDDVAMRGISSM